MNKVAIVYWSGTGNTEKMAFCIAEGVKEAGGEAVMLAPGAFSAGSFRDYGAVAFGCPAMGAEVLEEEEFEPMFSACKAKLSGKKIALFGSYGWGDGEWMRTWEQSCTEDGAVFAAESVICNDAPGEEALASCRALGAALCA